MKSLATRLPYPLVLIFLFLVPLKSIPAEEAFRVCADPNNPPLSDKRGSGFENKVAELFAHELGEEVEYTWFPQRIGFIRNTLKAKLPDKDDYKCDVVMSVPTGFELALTTKPYYRSTYALIYAKNRGWDAIKTPDDLFNLPPERRSRLRIAMFDRTPGTTWLLRHGLFPQGVTYQSMTGDPDQNAAITLEKDLKDGKIDMAIVWGPFAGYILMKNPDSFKILPMKSEPGIRFHYSMSMAVRYGEKWRKEQLDELIERKSAEIEALLKQYHIPLVDEEGNSIAAR